MDLPAHYHPANARDWAYAPDQRALFEAADAARAEQAYERYARPGMHLVDSTNPMAEWPGMRL